MSTVSRFWSFIRKTLPFHFDALRKFSTFLKKQYRLCLVLDHLVGICGTVRSATISFMRYSTQKWCSQMHSNAFCSQNPKSGCQDNGYVYLWDSQVFKFPLPLCSIHWGTSRRNRPVGHGLFERARSLLQLSFFLFWWSGDEVYISEEHDQTVVGFW